MVGSLKRGKWTMRTWRSRPRNWQIAVLGCGAFIILTGCAAPFGSWVGSSESYRWGEHVVDTAETLVARAGVDYRKACEAAIGSGEMFADSPVLNPTPPPKNFDRTDAIKGCLDQLHKRRGGLTRW